MFFILSTLFALLSFQSRVYADVGVYNDYQQYQYGSQWGPAPAQRYVSDASIWGPLLNVPIWDRKALSVDETPHLLMSLIYDGRMGPNIFDSKDLSLVYTNQSFPFVNNVRVQQYKGERVLTFWMGKQGKHHAEGHCVALNQHYDVIWNITSSSGFEAGADLHECEITHDDTVLVTVYEPTHDFDLSSVGGALNDTLLDSCFEEIDPSTGAVLFSWRASTHLTPSASFHPYAKEGKDGWDAWHINSLQKTREGNFIVDLRRARAVILVDGTNGWPIWMLGGKANDFEDLSGGAATAFAWQHHARFLDEDLTQLTMFDNRALAWDYPVGGSEEFASRGLRLEIQHYPRRTVKLVHERFAHAKLGAYAMGSYDTLPNGNALIGWGSQAGFSEYTADGRCIMDVQFGRYNTYMRTYRVYKDTWLGLPKWNPKMAIDLPNSIVHVSWNGATEVRSWAVIFANDHDALSSLTGRSDSMTVRADKKGFETAIDVKDAFEKYELVRIAGLDKDENVLGATDIAHVNDGRTWQVERPIAGMFYNQKYNTVVSQLTKRPRSMHVHHHHTHG